MLWLCGLDRTQYSLPVRRTMDLNLALGYAMWFLQFYRFVVLESCCTRQGASKYISRN